MARKMLRNVAVGTLTAASLTVVTTGCSGPSIDIDKAQDVTVQEVSLADAPEAESVIQATRTLGLEILGAFPGGTLVTSPASTVIGLSMLGSGATGATEEQLSQLLGASGVERDKAVNALIGSLAPYRDDVENIDTENLKDSAQLHLANQVVLDDQLLVEQTYLENLAKWFNAGVLKTDLGSSDGKRALEAWVKKSTAGLIEKSAVEPNPNLRFVLQNAVVFAAQWEQKFAKSNTYSQPFYLEDGGVVEPAFMHNTIWIDYASFDGWQMISLPYKSLSGSLVARYVMPPDGTSITEVTPDLVASLEGALASEEVTVEIPKLDLQSSANLIPPLQQEGLDAVFSYDPPALEYIGKDQQLFVSQVVQQGAVRLDEEGTVAAVVTEIAGDAGAVPGQDEPIVFTADRPHLIIIQDKEVGWDLFQILVNDPIEN